MEKVTLRFLSVAIFLVAVVGAHEHGDPTPSPVPTPCPKPTFNTSHIPFSTTSLLCSSVWPSQDFVLMFKNSDDYKTWNFVLSTPSDGSYVGIGFSMNGEMIGSSAVAGWLAADGKGTAKQYLLAGKSPEQCKPDAGDLDLVKGKTVIFGESSRIYLAFQLNTSIDQPKNRLIYAIGSLPGPDNLLPVHKDHISTAINYVTKHQAPAPSPIPQGPLKDGTPKKSSSVRLVATTLLTVPIILSHMAVGFL